MATKASLKTIRLNLARTPDYPSGSDRHGYRFTAAIDDDGHLDAELWRQHRQHCRVVRFWGDEEKDIGHLVHRGSGWAFHYDLSGDEGDEVGFKLAGHRFVPGEYVSVRDDEGELHPFLVASVQPVT